MADWSASPTIRFLQRLGAARCAGDPDSELLTRFVSQHDESAFAALVQRHGSMVLSVCRRILRDPHDADDAFQASFLVLARKAAAIKKPELLGNWLYGVACRTAANAKRLRAARQSAPIDEVQEMPSQSPELTPSEREYMRSMLDEELERLPVKYRAPLVLCYLEGMTYTEVARRLGKAEGTVSAQLSRGRERLRNRLARRGLVLSAGLVVHMLTECLGEAGVPSALASSTVKAGTLFALGEAGAAGISMPTVTLAEGVLRTMWMSKIKLVAAACIVITAVACGAGMVAYRALAEPSPAAEAKPIVFKADVDRLPKDAGLIYAYVKKPISGELKWQQIPWTVDLHEGIRLAQTEKRPLLMFVSGDDPLEKC